MLSSLGGAPGGLAQARPSLVKTGLRSWPSAQNSFTQPDPPSRTDLLVFENIAQCYKIEMCSHLGYSPIHSFIHSFDQPLFTEHLPVTAQCAERAHTHEKPAPAPREHTVQRRQGACSRLQQEKGRTTVSHQVTLFWWRGAGSEGSAWALGNGR